MKHIITTTAALLAGVAVAGAVAAPAAYAVGGENRQTGKRHAATGQHTRAGHGSAPQRCTQTPGQLDAAQADTLAWMLDEEKLARDVYAQLATRYDSTLFARISASENRHMNAVARLGVRYGIEDNTSALPAGDYVNDEFDAAYVDLLAQADTYQNALAVGAKIEQGDIDDLTKAIADSTAKDAMRVYANLRRASTHHLRAFTS